MTDDNSGFRRRDLAKWPHLLVRAIWELGRARMSLSDIGPNEVKRLNILIAKQVSRTAQNTNDVWQIERIGFVITFASRHVPWRSDCLPQAIAAQHWLLTKGFVSEIRIGVERPEDGDFGAHAWLVHDELVVTGGAIDKFAVLLGKDAPENETASSVSRSEP